MPNTSEHDAQDTSRLVGLALIGIGAWSALHGAAWIWMRGSHPALDPSFEGAEGMLVTCVIFVGLGLWMARPR